MSKFKNIERLGLRVHSVSGLTVVSADSLEELLQSAQVVYEVENSAGINSWLHIEAIGAKSKALLIGITPIRKQTKAEAALEFMDKLAKDYPAMCSAFVVDQAKRILDMKDEV